MRRGGRAAYRALCRPRPYRRRPGAPRFRRVQAVDRGTGHRGGLRPDCPSGRRRLQVSSIACRRRQPPRRQVLHPDDPARYARSHDGRSSKCNRRRGEREETYLGNHRVGGPPTLTGDRRSAQGVPRSPLLPFSCCVSDSRLPRGINETGLENIALVVLARNTAALLRTSSRFCCSLVSPTWPGRPPNRSTHPLRRRTKIPPSLRRRHRSGNSHRYMKRRPRQLRPLRRQSDQTIQDASPSSSCPPAATAEQPSGSCHPATRSGSVRAGSPGRAVAEPASSLERRRGTARAGQVRLQPMKSRSANRQESPQLACASTSPLGTCFKQINGETQDVCPHWMTDFVPDRGVRPRRQTAGISRLRAGDETCNRAARVRHRPGTMPCAPPCAESRDP